MLNLLQNDNNKDYVTRKELDALIKHFQSMKVGAKGNDAYVTEELIDALIKEVRPTQAELEKAIKPLIPAPVVGKDGEKGKDGTEISAVDLMNKLKSVKGDERLLIDNIRGGKKIIGKMIDLENATKSLNNNFGYINEFTEEMDKDLRDKIKKLEIAINSGSNIYVNGQSLIGATLRTTRTDGVFFDTDLSSIAGGGAGASTVSSVDGSVAVNLVGINYDLSVPEDAASVTYDNTASGLTATEVQAAIDELDTDLDTLASIVAGLPTTDKYSVSGSLVAGNNTIRIVLNDASTFDVDVTALNGGTPVIVSTDADNEITVGTDGGAYFQQILTAITSVDSSITLTPIANGFDLSVDPSVLDLSTLDWSTITNWDSFLTSLTTNWSASNWNNFTSSFFSNLSAAEINTFIGLWNPSNFGTFIDEWVSNTTAGDWNTFIDAFITNVDSDDVQNFLDQYGGTKGDILVNDGTNWNKLPVGTDGQVLSVDSIEANGVKWGDVSNGGFGGQRSFTTSHPTVSNVFDTSAEITGGNNPGAMCYDGTNFWVRSSSGVVFKYSGAGVYTGTSFTPTYSLGLSGYGDVESDGTHLYISDWKSTGTGELAIRKYDLTASGTVLATYTIGNNVPTGFTGSTFPGRGIAWDGTYFWVTHDMSNSSAGHIIYRMSSTFTSPKEFRTSTTTWVHPLSVGMAYHNGSLYWGGYRFKADGSGTAGSSIFSESYNGTGVAYHTAKDGYLYGFSGKQVTRSLPTLNILTDNSSSGIFSGASVGDVLTIRLSQANFLTAPFTALTNDGNYRIASIIDSNNVDVEGINIVSGSTINGWPDNARYLTEETEYLLVGIF